MTSLSSFTIVDPHALGLNVASVSNIFLSGEVSVLCPYHDDNDASASYNAKRGKFYCYACGKAATTAELAFDLDGEVLPYIGPTNEYVRQDREELGHLLFQQLQRDKVGIHNEYLASRQISEKTMKQHGAWVTDYAVVFPFYYDMFRKASGFQIRFLPKFERQTRYLKYGSTRESAYPEDWANSPHDRIHRSPRPVVVTEGIFGAMRAWQNGYNGIALTGASSSVRNLLKIAWDSWSISEPMYLYLDNDDAGLSSAAHFVTSFPYIEPVVVKQPADEISDKAWRNLDRFKLSSWLARQNKPNGHRDVVRFIYSKVSKAGQKTASKMISRGEWYRGIQEKKHTARLLERGNILRSYHFGQVQNRPI